MFVVNYVSTNYPQFLIYATINGLCKMKMIAGKR